MVGLLCQLFKAAPTLRYQNWRMGPSSTFGMWCLCLTPTLNLATGHGTASQHLLPQQHPPLPVAPAQKPSHTAWQQGWPVLSEMRGERLRRESTQRKKAQRMIFLFSIRQEQNYLGKQDCHLQEGRRKNRGKKKKHSHSFSGHDQLLMIQIKKKINLYFHLLRSSWTPVAAGAWTFQSNLGTLGRSGPEHQFLTQIQQR